MWPVRVAMNLRTTRKTSHPLTMYLRISPLPVNEKESHWLIIYPSLFYYMEVSMEQRHKYFLHCPFLIHPKFSNTRPHCGFGAIESYHLSYHRSYHLSSYFFLLTISLDAPTCKPGQKTVYGAARQEAVRVSCELEADPQDVTFRWRFNSSKDLLSSSNVISEATRSWATVMPAAEDDYGTLLCWGKNGIGIQREPCFFTLIPAGECLLSFNSPSLFSEFCCVYLE